MEYIVMLAAKLKIFKRVLAMNKFVEIVAEKFIKDIFGIVINKLNAGGGFNCLYSCW